MQKISSPTGPSSPYRLRHPGPLRRFGSFFSVVCLAYLVQRSYETGRVEILAIHFKQLGHFLHRDNISVIEILYQVRRYVVGLVSDMQIHTPICTGCCY
jgi:hypothetical protein